MHTGQLAVSAVQVRALVARQFPQWRELAIKEVASAGTVNAIFRIGEQYTARFPLQPMATDAALRWLHSEAEAARELAGRTRFPTPEPVAFGEPGEGYPLPWAVQTWLPGTVATEEDPGASVPFALDLAEFITGVRSIDTCGRKFRGTGRGGDLRAHDQWMETCFRRSEELLDVPTLRKLWTELRELPRVAPDAMTHGDLMPGNVLVSRGRLAGVLDVGGLGPADPALDLVGAWHLLEPEPRQVLRDRLGTSELEWQRGMAWALQQAMGLVWYYADANPVMSRIGRRTLARILASRAG
ncbi:MAG: aminoglycoside phosphotransferase family protein [Actinobacteria bacterium]|nr:aminoglycoside phosphotransferase family protein [Actinomycetota bacterium]